MKKLYVAEPGLRRLTGSLMIVVLLGSFDRYGASSRNSTRVAIQTPSVRVVEDSASPSFLLISDIHLHGEDDQSPDITKNSDSGKDLWDSAKKKIGSLLSGQADYAEVGHPIRIDRPKFIIYLGDLPWHAKNNDTAQISDAMDNAGKVLKDLRRLAAGAHIPLLYVPGNNDSEEGDYAPFSATIFRKDQGGVKQWPVIGGSPEDTTAWALGCYADYPLGHRGGPLVLVLNSNIFTAKYDSVAGKERQTADAEKALKWLGSQLRSAAANHRKVLIAMHVPPGKDGYLRAAPGRETCTGNFKELWDPFLRLHREGRSISAQDAFLDLVDTWQHSIIGIVSSHTHMDGVRLLKNRRGDSTTALLISVPGIAPGHGNNPGIKLIRYDPVNFQLNDFITFYEDFFPDRTVKTWGDLSFSFRQVFHGASPSLTSPPASMLERLKALPPDSLRRQANSIYTVYNGDGYGNGNCVDTTLFVYYQFPEGLQ